MEHLSSHKYSIDVESEDAGIVTHPCNVDPSIDNQTQQTKFQQQFSSFYFPLLTVVPPLYRSTHSDIMCTSNNGIRTDYDKGTSISTSCQLPYEEIYASHHSRKMNGDIGRTRVRNQTRTRTRRNNKNQEKRESRHATHRRGEHETLLQQKHKLDSQKKIDRQLHSEHRTYMEHLKREREERLIAETQAVVVIQSFMRAFVVRRRLNPEKYSEWNEKKGLVYNENEIWRMLLDVTSNIGVYPDESRLLGFTLPQVAREIMK